MSKMTTTQALRLGMLLGRMGRVEEAAENYIKYVLNDPAASPALHDHKIDLLENSIGGMLGTLNMLFESGLIDEEKVRLASLKEQRDFYATDNPASTPP